MTDKTLEEIMDTPPQSLEEAIERTIIIINNEVPEVWSESESRFTTMLHHGLGQHIRNYWGLWSQNSGLYKELAGKFCLSHADDLSGLLLTAVYRTHKGKPLNLEQEAAGYHKHWAETFKK